MGERVRPPTMFKNVTPLCNKTAVLAARKTTFLDPKLLCLLAVSLSLRFGLFQLSTERLDVGKIDLQLGAQPVDLEVDLTGVGSVRLRYLVQLSKERCDVGQTALQLEGAGA